MLDDGLHYFTRHSIVSASRFSEMLFLKIGQFL